MDRLGFFDEKEQYLFPYWLLQINNVGWDTYLRYFLFGEKRWIIVFKNYTRAQLDDRIERESASRRHRNCHLHSIGPIFISNDSQSAGSFG
jgi:spore cortex formation protein SpoVR/YcgB (stage V sporulation)